MKVVIFRELYKSGNSYQILDLIGTWEELLVELKSRLDQCLAFNGINKEIEIISLKVESISNQKLNLETQEENEAISFKEGLKVI